MVERVVTTEEVAAEVGLTIGPKIEYVGTERAVFHRRGPDEWLRHEDQPDAPAEG